MVNNGNIVVYIDMVSVRVRVHVRTFECEKLAATNRMKSDSACNIICNNYVQSARVAFYVLLKQVAITYRI